MCRLSKDAVDAILKNGKIYEVGGAVRDKYLGDAASIKDYDYLVTGISYKELTKLLKPFGKIDLVGQSFGVIKFTQYKSNSQHTFDIALPRKEFSTGIGHKDFNVSFDPQLNVEEDLARRDFTINAMAVELGSNELIDPLDGMIDLEKKQLKIVYQESFKDDPLRMLRAVQFSARFKFMIEPETFRLMRENASLINSVSPERINEELSKLLALSQNPSDGFRVMESTGLLKEVLPELAECIGVDQPGGYHAYDVYEHSLRIIDACPARLRIRMAAMFHDINKPQCKRIVEKGATFYGHESVGARTAKKVLRRLRYSNDFINEVQVLVERHMFTTEVSDKGMRRLIRKTGLDLIFDLLDLRRADVIAQGMGGNTDDVDVFEKRIRDEIAKKPPFGLSDLEINGVRIMELFSLEPGPVIGEVLEYLMEKVLDDPSDNQAEILEKYAKEYLNYNNDKGQLI